jgi:hypothetical protein
MVGYNGAIIAHMVVSGGVKVKTMFFDEHEHVALAKAIKEADECGWTFTHSSLPSGDDMSQMSKAIEAYLA